MKLECPQCQKVLKCADRLAGKRGQCPRCKTKFKVPASANEAKRAPLPTAKTVTTDDGPFVQLAEPNFLVTDENRVLYQDELVTVWLDGNADFRIQTTEQATLAIRVLRLLNKQLRIMIRHLNHQLREARHEYTAKVSRRTLVIRGGGIRGRIIRLEQTNSREVQRNELAQNVEPLHRQVQTLDRLMLSIDQHKLRIQAHLLRLRMSD